MYNQIDESTTAYLKQRRKGRLTFIAIALLFFGPFILAALAHKLGWTPEGDTVNRGQLIQAESPLTDADFAVVGRDDNIRMRGKWSLLFFVPKTCNEECKAGIDRYEVVHFRLNRDIERVQIIALNDQDILKSPFARRIAKGEDTQQVLDSLKLLGLQAQGIILVDPLGFPVAQYALSDDAENLQKDLKRLLKYSRVG